MSIRDLFNNAGEAIGQAGKAAADFFDKAQKTVVKAVDANDDGKFDFNDIKAVADKAGNAVQKAVTDVKLQIDEKEKIAAEKKHEAKIKAELNELCPIFKHDLKDLNFRLSNLIRIVDPDKKHLESEACAGSIGYLTKDENTDMINIYKQDVSLFGITAYPDSNSEAYYVDPVDRDQYISLDKYFETIKLKRVNELVDVAQKLGATEFSVKNYEKHSNAAKKAQALQVQAGPAKGNAKHESDEFGQTEMELDILMKCMGHEPVEPELKYLKDEVIVQDLIKKRMNGELMKSYKFNFRFANTSGIKEKDAVKKLPKRPPLNFFEMGMHIGDELVFVNNPNVKVIIQEAKKVTYEGELYSLTAVTKILLNKSYDVQPTSYWTYNGRNLHNIYDETYPLNEE